MKNLDRIKNLTRLLVERALDPSPERYLDHVRIRNFGRPKVVQSRVRPEEPPAEASRATMAFYTNVRMLPRNDSGILCRDRHG